MTRLLDFAIKNLKVVTFQTKKVWSSNSKTTNTVRTLKSYIDTEDIFVETAISLQSHLSAPIRVERQWYFQSTHPLCCESIITSITQINLADIGLIEAGI